jgi:hypothetical protein
VRVTAPRAQLLGRFLFVFYVVEAGAFLVLAPWSRFWIRRVVTRSPASLHFALMSPYLRSFLVAVGLLHLFVAIREIEAWRRQSASGPRVPAPPEPARLR